jgi:hypothetical protein
VVFIGCNKNFFRWSGFNTLQVCEQVPADYESLPACDCLVAAPFCNAKPFIQKDLRQLTITIGNHHDGPLLLAYGVPP